MSVTLILQYEDVRKDRLERDIERIESDSIRHKDRWFRKRRHELQCTNMEKMKKRKHFGARRKLLCVSDVIEITKGKYKGFIGELSKLDLVDNEWRQFSVRNLHSPEMLKFSRSQIEKYEVT